MTRLGTCPSREVEGKAVYEDKPAGFNGPRILGADGRPTSRPAVSDGKCPGCKAPKERRIVNETFGGTETLCGKCGQKIEGEEP